MINFHLRSIGSYLILFVPVMSNSSNENILTPFRTTGPLTACIGTLWEGDVFSHVFILPTKEGWAGDLVTLH